MTAAALEESAAVRKHRNLERARKAAEQKRASARRKAMREVILRTAKQHPSCRCVLDHHMTNDDLRALGSGCTSRFVCPRLDAVRRRVGI